jgi:multisubunit Na+/H+ antiporter MnhE subunit
MQASLKLFLRIKLFFLLVSFSIFLFIFSIFVSFFIRDVFAHISSSMSIDLSGFFLFFIYLLVSLIVKSNILLGISTL